MYITAVEAFFILFATMIGIYIIYKSRMSLLATEAFVEANRERSKASLIKLSEGLAPLVETRKEFEKFTAEQKELPTIMCMIDANKVCDLCGLGGDSCPFANGGDVA